ncbi:MAG: glycoside hydrolase [Sphingobacteriales bacterium]|nr:MAG: glycoside hydrolase [Sphingobacteriales bacterium]
MLLSDITSTINNPVIRNVFTADPTVIVHNDTVYLYTGHDEPATGEHDYAMNEWLCFSSKDLVQWKQHDINFKATDFAWAKGDAFASKVLEYADKFYWFAAVSHKEIPGQAIGIAVADSPTGPFKDAKNAALITGDMISDNDHDKINMDPAAIIDEDGQPYIFWGYDQCYCARLTPDMTELGSRIHSISLPGFTEGAHIHKHKNWYYLSYGYGSPEKVAYAMSRAVTGPWEFKGILNEIPANCNTNRPAIIEFKNKCYFFYHNGALKGGDSHRRSVCIDELHYNPDGTMMRVVMTSEGVMVKD